MFFIGVSIKIAVLVSWRTTPVPFCWYNDVQLEVQKRCSYLKNIALNFVLWVLKLYAIQVAVSLLTSSAVLATSKVSY